MTDKLKEQLNIEIIKLPKENRDAINGFDWAKVTEEIGKSFSFTEDEIDNLQLETGLVLVGLVNFDLYSKNVEYNIGMSSREAENLVREVFEKVFTPIGETIESLIKKEGSSQNAEWGATVNFIISGGDYSFFTKK